VDAGRLTVGPGEEVPVRAVLRAVYPSVLVLLLAAPVHALSLRDRMPAVARLVGIAGPPTAFDAVSDAIADTVARQIPVVAASAGFTYRYNPELEVFERTSDTLGPLFLERPDTLGRGKLNLNVSFQYVELNEIDGTATNELEAPERIVLQEVGPGGVLVRKTANSLRYNLKLINHVFGVSATYGVLDNLDVNLLVPVIETNYDVTANNTEDLEQLPGGTYQRVGGPLQSGTLRATKLGVGDLLLRTKYQLPRQGMWRSALGLQLRLPSGDEDNFHGTGTFEASPFLYVSTIVGSRFEPHADVGVDLRADDVQRSQARYGLGVDFDVTKRIGAALAFLGRSEFKRSSPAGETSFRHLINPATSTEGQRPLLGIEFDRKDFFDFSFGARAVVWRQIMVFVNGIYALNDDGLRNDSVIPMVGFEGTF
jgi:hypothetical protein